MNFLGFFVAGIVIISLYISYMVYRKILDNKNTYEEKKSFFEKGFLLLFINLVVISINILTFVLSYSYVWEKTFRAYSEPKYEAIVIGYKKEIIKVQNFRGSSSYGRPILFPKVKYTNEEGNDVVKTLDITSNFPLAIGDKVLITDSELQTNANILNIDWIMLILMSIFASTGSFFVSLIATYSKGYTLKKRISLSLFFALCITILNILCIVLLYKKY